MQEEKKITEIKIGMKNGMQFSFVYVKLRRVRTG